jgi:hypothetical protein
VEKLSLVENKAVEFGYKIAKGIAGFDIGQTVVVKDKSVLAVELVEGTNECVRHVHKLGEKKKDDWLKKFGIQEFLQAANISLGSNILQRKIRYYKCKWNSVALYSSLNMWSFKLKDKVVTTLFSFIVTSNSILFCGAKPVFRILTRKL